MIKYPDSLVNMLGRNPQIGDWVTQCCQEDLYQIKDEEDLAVLADQADEDPGIMGWPTYESAIQDIESFSVHSEVSDLIYTR